MAHSGNSLDKAAVQCKCVMLCAALGAVACRRHCEGDAAPSHWFPPKAVLRSNFVSKKGDVPKESLLWYTQRCLQNNR